jgi:DNA-binding winged helix-turn-helix (wHTH) protein
MPRAARLRVGDCVVDVDRREVLRPGAVAPARITVKALHVLLVLAEDAGRVVPRERLLDTVWAGTLPTLDVVTQAIAALRRAFADRAHAPACIETIPKSGYVLLAPVAWLPADPVAISTRSPQVPPVRGIRAGPWRWLAAVLGIATVGGVDGSDAGRLASTGAVITAQSPESAHTPEHIAPSRRR